MPVSDGEPEAEPDGPYWCEACGRRFQSEKALDEHVRRVGLAE